MKKQDNTWATGGNTEMETVLMQALDRPVAYHRIFRRITGSTVAAVFLSQAWYWTPRTTRQDGFFWKTQSEWEDETGLTRSEQETARRILVGLGFIQEKLAGIPARMHFKVNVASVCSAICQFATLRHTGLQ